MKHHITDELLSRFVDGEVSPDEARRVREALAGDPSLQKTLAGFNTQLALHRDLPVEGTPTPEAMWQDVQRAIRNAEPEPVVRPLLFPWRLGWAGAIVATALVAVGTYVAYRKPVEITVAAAVDTSTRVEFVEAGDADASTMVYEDAETGWTVIWVASAEPRQGVPGT